MNLVEYDEWFYFVNYQHIEEQDRLKPIRHIIRSVQYLTDVASLNAIRYSNPISDFIKEQLEIIRIYDGYQADYEMKKEWKK